MADKSKVAQPPAPPQRLNYPAPVGAQAGRVAGTAFVRAGFLDPSLVLRWSEIAGPEVARLAQPVRYSAATKEGTGGTLTLLAIPGSALFLAHEKRSLCERINAYLGRTAVVQLKFHQRALLSRPLIPQAVKPVRNLAPNDPSARYQGPEGLGKALLALARRRATDH